jgi:AAA15 family ATPase/GTPase
MIRKYTFENFYSFLEETEVSLLANKQVPDSNNLIALADGSRVSKVTVVLGHNASGKTKLLMPLAFMSWFMSCSFRAALDSAIPFETHMASDSDVMMCDIEFSLPNELGGEDVYRYELESTQSYVVREALYVKGKRFKYVFIREWDDEAKQYNVKQQGFGFKGAEAQKVRKNASLIATAAQYGVPFAEKLVLAAHSVFTNVTMGGKRHLDDDLLNESTAFYHENNYFLDKLNAQIKRLDFGIDEVSITKVELPDGGERLIPLCRHQSKGKRFSLPLLSESSGTRGVYSILRYILPVLEHGGIAVLDEMESELHPQMAIEIMRLFTDKDSNPHNAQLLTATHSLEVLQYVEKNQIYLVEKNDCVSEAWRLDEMKGVRRDDNIYARYLAGAYGATANFS